MPWPFRRRHPISAPTRQPHVRPMALALADAGVPFVCTDCGRTDLAPAIGWDPPICEECDAAINFEVELELGLLEPRDG